MEESPFSAGTFVYHEFACASKYVIMLSNTPVILSVLLCQEMATVDLANMLLCTMDSVIFCYCYVCYYVCHGLCVMLQLAAKFEWIQCLHNAVQVI